MYMCMYRCDGVLFLLVKHWSLKKKKREKVVEQRKRFRVYVGFRNWLDLDFRWLVLGRAVNLKPDLKSDPKKSGLGL